MLPYPIAYPWEAVGWVNIFSWVLEVLAWI